MSKDFIDTNVIVYANDGARPAKQQQAIDCVTARLRTGTGVISTQVLMEYASVATGKLGQEQEAIDRQLLLLDRLEVVRVDRKLIQHGLDLRRSFDISFWDGVVLAAAIAARCDVLLSEDFSHGRTYAGVEVRNPFVE